MLAAQRNALQGGTEPIRCVCGNGALEFTLRPRAVIVKCPKCGGKWRLGGRSSRKGRLGVV